jgi:uncharacterized membrane protein
MSEEENNMHQDPNNWKFGVFYFNPKDKRVLVLKRIPGLGVTFNFGNPFTVIAILLTIIVIGLLSKM